MFSQAAIFTLFAAVASAVHAPVGNPSGNAITRPLNEIVPACKPFTITWDPTTPNTVSLLLLRGPSTNVVPIGAPIAQGIANSGTFVWTPSSDLEADTTHYGIQLIDDKTGQYQYSTQFGISKNDCASTSSSASVAAASSATFSSSVVTVSASSASSNGSYAVKVASTSVGIVGTVSSGLPPASSIVQPTVTLSVPASLQTSATAVVAATSASASPTGAASSLRVGMGGLAGAVAGLMFLL